MDARGGGGGGGEDVSLDVQDALARMVLGWMAERAKASVPRGDMEAATSAFLSDVAASEYSRYFPWLEPTR
jgi:hypothetical protein